MQTKDMRIDFELFDLCGTAGLVVNWSSDLAFCSLGENPRLPSAQWFAECIPSDTQQTTHLPSVKNKTLRKKNTQQNIQFAECKTKYTWQKS